jgi:hypothetical protein
MNTVTIPSSKNITIPRSALTGIYRKMQNMKKSYEELDHMIAQVEEIQGKTIKTTPKTLAHDLGY